MAQFIDHRPRKSCANCGKPDVPSKDTKLPAFCSQRCAAEYRQRANRFFGSRSGQGDRPKQDRQRL